MKKAMLGLGLAAVATISVWKLRDNEEVKHDDNLALDRFWIDHLPRNDRDTFQIFLAVTEQPFGAFQAASKWKGAYEIFHYEAHDNELRVLFPQNGDREQIKAKATRCREKGFDYCLELEGSSRGVTRYYSQKGWEIDGSLAHAREQIEAKIAAGIEAKR